MKRYSRAGRKLYIRSVLRMEFRKMPARFFSTGEIARRIGMKSSTHLKNILREMEKEFDEIITSNFDGIERWKFQPYKQASFLDRIPVIKNKGIEYPVETKSTLGKLLNMLITEVQS